MSCAHKYDHPKTILITVTSSTLFPCLGPELELLLVAAVDVVDAVAADEANFKEQLNGRDCWSFLSYRQNHLSVLLPSQSPRPLIAANGGEERTGRRSEMQPSDMSNGTSLFRT